MHFAHPADRLTVVVQEPDADRQVRILLRGELDSDETGRLSDAVAEAIQRHVPARLVLDATELGFLDSAGIRALLHCQNLAERAGAELSVWEASPIVYQVLQVTHLLDYLGVTAAV
jgi:anti-anti-sigma factor